MDETNSKICTKCNVSKPLDDFYNRKDTKSGKRSMCKSCVVITQYAWQRKNIEHYNAYQAEYKRTKRKKAEDG